MDNPVDNTSQTNTSQTNPSDSRISWDDWGLALARTTALRADCSRRQVGAVIVAPDKRVVAAGYAGAPPGELGCLTAGACPRATSGVAANSSYRNCISIHAEVNALLRASWDDMVGATLYCTDEPCPDCAKVVSAAPLARVVVGRVGEGRVLDG